MQTIDARAIRTFAHLGQRGSIFGMALPELAAERDDIYVATADLGLLSGLERFMESYPSRYVNVGIAEQNLIGITAGIANEGNCVFATTYATFITMRSFEQIRHHLGYQKRNVKVVGATAGLSMGMSGNTHYAIEDFSLMRSIPNMTILSPADSLEAYKAAYAAADIDGPVYIRLTGLLNTPRVYREDYNFQVGKAVRLKDGADIIILATGTVCAAAVSAAGKLEEDGYSCAVFDAHTLKPFDYAPLYAAKDAKLVVTIEEHSIIGGLGSATAEAMASIGNMPPLLRLGIKDRFFRADTYENLLNSARLDTDDIVFDIRDVLRGGR